MKITDLFEDNASTLKRLAYEEKWHGMGAPGQYFDTLDWGKEHYGSTPTLNISDLYIGDKDVEANLRDLEGVGGKKHPDWVIPCRIKVENPCGHHQLYDLMSEFFGENSDVLDDYSPAQAIVELIDFRNFLISKGYDSYVGPSVYYNEEPFQVVPFFANQIIRD
jgi:hypothetical protein